MRSRRTGPFIRGSALVAVRQNSLGLWYFVCDICGTPETADSERQAEAAEALHMLRHEDEKGSNGKS